MKVFISADMEGISGVVSPEQTMSECRYYEQARLLMTEDVNAAVAGLREGGATEILVHDGHNNALNVDISRLVPGVELISGSTRRFRMMHGLDQSFDGAVLLGYHGRASMAAAVMDHSYYTKSVLDIRVNGQPCGEIELNTLYAAYLGVPVVLVTGDRAAAEAAEKFNPWCRTVAVKDGQGRFCARCLPLDVSRQKIREASREALLSRPNASLVAVPEKPVLEMVFPDANLADTVNMVPGTSRVDARTVRLQCGDLKELYLWRQVFTILADAFVNKYY